MNIYYCSPLTLDMTTFYINKMVQSIKDYRLTSSTLCIETCSHIVVNRKSINVLVSMRIFCEKSRRMYLTETTRLFPNNPVYVHCIDSIMYMFAMIIMLTTFYKIYRYSSFHFLSNFHRKLKYCEPIGIYIGL